MQSEDKVIAKFDGLFFHPDIHLQDWGTFRGEPDPLDRVASVWSKHEILEYWENDAPSHWNLPPVVNTSNTPIIEELEYNSSWDWLMPVIEKIESYGYMTEIKNDFVLIYALNEVHIFEPVSTTKIAAAHKACYRFIEWFNNKLK